MRTSFNKAFEIVIGLEGKPTIDEGGYTIWGLASKYNPIVNPSTTIEEAKDIYLYKYWISNGCDKLPFPMDICVFDTCVNPQNDPSLPGGPVQELLDQNPENWQDFLFFRMQRYHRCSKSKYREGHKNRVLNLHAKIKAIK